jgi:hypothetical protein
MNNIQRGHVTCYICWIQALAPQFSNSPWTGTKRKAQEKLVDATSANAGDNNRG